MLRRLLLASALLGAMLSGCLDADEPPADAGEPLPISGVAGPLYQGSGSLFAGPALYRDPQNAPHPAFNFPTLANPAVGANVPAHWKPIPATDLPAAISGIDHVAQAPGVPSGAGIAIFGSIVAVPGGTTSIVDISDPAAPKVLSQFEPQEQMGSHRGAAFIPYPDGRLSVIFATGSGIDHWDLTDPTMPKPMPFLDPDGGSHKVGVIPGTPIVVNAASDGGAAGDPETSPGISKMWDLSDPENPQALPDFKNGYSCHHVYFWNDAEQGKHRGVCAGIQYTQIWDTADPYNPSVIVSVPFGSGGTPADAADRSVVFPLSLSHYAGLSSDGTILMMGDESGGGGAPPGCTVRADVPGVGSVSMPVGAVWFYDVTVESEPELLGWYSASKSDQLQGGGSPPRSCTAHHGRLVPDLEGRDMLAMSFYGAGVVLLDFSDPMMPMMVDQFKDGTNT
ncbi:MAG TPA: hypothetical protein VJ874_06460, partial [Candidatus Thermoplasmatota archaeon]|nr:hypothetical protein [Candidatus Thermoplasmatota archaeon]